jgi:replicative superfamily II helicase
MSRTTVIEERFADATLNLALDTIGKGKQALVFCNTKRGAESQAGTSPSAGKESAGRSRSNRSLEQRPPMRIRAIDRKRVPPSIQLPTTFP